MKNRIICVVACMMMLAGCLGLCSCGNYRVFDTTFTYSWAQIKLPDGTIVQGKVDNWTDYEGDQLWGDRIFEKCGIGRDEGGDGGKTLEIRGKRRLSARDGGANYQQS